MESIYFQGKFPGPKKVRVREKGQFTIPSDFRKRIGIKADTVLDVYQIGKAIIVTPADLLVKELAKQVQQEVQKNNYTLTDLLADLREGSHDYFEED